MLSFVENKLTCNQDLVCPWSPNFNMLAGVRIANEDPFPSFINIRFSAFLTGYKSTCFAAKDPKVLDILSVSSSCFFWDNCAFGTLCRKFIPQIVRDIYSFCLEIDWKVTINK